MSRSGVGLREIKKQMTRDEIAAAALQVTVDEGFEQLTVDKIAHQAFVSPRTVSNYFSCKEEAVMAAGNDYWGKLIDQLAGRPCDEPPLVGLRALLVQAVRTAGDDDARRAIQTMKLGWENPALHRFQLTECGRLEELLREAVAKRTGTDVGGDLYPWLIAGSAVVAIKAAVALWLTKNAPDADLADMIESAFDEITPVSQPR